MLVVVDTNIVVSALMSKSGAPAKLMGLVLSGRLTPCYDYRILTEYREVLRRPRFNFTTLEIDALLEWFEHYGYSIIADYLDVNFTDISDKKFYEVAKFCGAILITGNLRHYPTDSQIMSVSDFLKKYDF